MALINILTVIIPIILCLFGLIRFYNAHLEIIDEKYNFQMITMIFYPPTGQDPLEPIFRTYSWWMIYIIILLEELVFRLWLVLIFDSFTTWAWVCIVGVSLVFGLCHMFPNPADNEGKKKLRHYSILKTLITFMVGLMLGITAIWSSLMIVPVAIHILWDVFAPRGINVWNRYQQRKITNKQRRTIEQNF